MKGSFIVTEMIKIKIQVRDDELSLSLPGTRAGSKAQKPAT